MSKTEQIMQIIDGLLEDLRAQLVSAEIETQGFIPSFEDKSVIENTVRLIIGDDDA